MAVTLTPYASVGISALNGEIDADSHTLKWRLLGNGYTPNLLTHRYASSLTNELSTAGGYTAGGLTATGVTLTYDNATGITKIDADDPEWNPMTSGTARYMALVDVNAGADASRPLLVLVDFGADVSPTVSLKVTLPAGGITLLDATP